MSRWETPVLTTIFAMAFLPLFVAVSIFTTNNGYPVWPFVEVGISSVLLTVVCGGLAGVGALYTTKLVAGELNLMRGDRDVSE